MRRREFIAGLGTAAAWPLAVRAQQGDRVRRIGVLSPRDENDPASKTFVSTYTQLLADLGWTVGRNVRIDLRWAGNDINRIRALARELVGLQPDVILASTIAVTAPPSPAMNSRRLVIRSPRRRAHVLEGEFRSLWPSTP